MTPDPRTTLADEGRELTVLGNRLLVKVSGAETGGAYELYQQRNEPGAGVPPHVHTREDETFYVISGEVRYRVGDKVVEASPGTTVFAPRGVPHGYTIVGRDAAWLLFLISPANLEPMFAELSALPAGEPDLGARGRNLRPLRDPVFGRRHVTVDDRLPAPCPLFCLTRAPRRDTVTHRRQDRRRSHESRRHHVARFDRAFRGAACLARCHLGGGSEAGRPDARRDQDRPRAAPSVGRKARRPAPGRLAGEAPGGRPERSNSTWSVARSRPRASGASSTSSRWVTSVPQSSALST